MQQKPLEMMGSVAGMDLALVSGRGERLLTDWPVVGKPLATDADIIQLGERDAEDPSFKHSYGDILRTERSSRSSMCSRKESMPQPRR